jgi:tetratricopeptide (TPR) repeat protein
MLLERSMAPFHVEEITLGQLLPPRIIGLPEFAKLEAACRDILAQTANLFRAIRWCLSVGPWDFAACVFPGIHRCHELANWLRSYSTLGAELCESMIAGCYEHHDLLLGQLLSQIDESVNVILISPTSNAVTPGVDNRESDLPALMHSDSRASGLAVICGPHVRHRAELIPRNLLDIAPTILAILEAPYGKDMGGRPLDDVFQNSLMPTVVDSWEPLQTPHEFLEKQHSTTTYATESSVTARCTETQHLSALGYEDPLEVAARETAIQRERTTILNRAISMMDAGLLAQAATDLEQLTHEYPDWLHSRSLLAETNYRLRRLGAARREIDWLTTHGFENPHLYLLSAAIETADHQFDRAIEMLDCARRGTILPSGSSFLKGNIHLRKHDLEAAESAFQHAIESNNMVTHALDGMAAVKLRKRQYEEAATYALDVLQKDMQFAKAHYHLGAALYFLNKPRESLQALASWASLEPLAAAPYRWMARVNRQLLHNSQQAQACLHQGQKVIRLRRQAIAVAREVNTSIPKCEP